MLFPQYNVPRSGNRNTFPPMFGNFKRAGSPSFFAALQAGLAAGMSLGSPTATFTRATTAYVLGYDAASTIASGPIQLLCASGEARFMGSRRIAQDNWSVLDANGVPLTTANGASALCTDAGGPFGYLSEGAGTQLLATADIRDMTTANWTLGATMTRARTSVGADGAANSATRLTGGAVAATNTCYTTIVAAASSRTYSALVKRVTGTGPVRIVQTGTETDISAQLNATGYALVQLTASVLNVAVGFKIDTNGDAIDVDFNQFEAGAFATSRMAATGAARNADVLTYPVLGNQTEAQGAAYAEYMMTTLNIGWVIGDSGGSTKEILASRTNASGIMSVDAGSNTATGAAGTPALNVVRKGAASWGGASMLNVINGVVGVPATYSGSFALTALGVGNNSAGTIALYGTIRNLRIYPTQLSAAQLQAMTA